MTDDTQDFVSAGLGIDIGNYNSKQTLCFFTRNGETELRRVEVFGPPGNDTPCPPNSLHEISARVGLDADGDVVTGRAAMEVDLSFTVTIKTLLLFGALGPHEVVKKAPDGPALLDAIEVGLIDNVRIDEMILRHLRLLWELSAEASSKSRLTITRCGLTYPSFLEDCTTLEVDKYIVFVERMSRQAYSMVCPGSSSPGYYTCSEGQATAQYICASLMGNIIGLSGHAIRSLRDELNMKQQMPLVIYDGGSSSLSIHVLVMAFDGELQLVHNWSIDIEGLRAGIQGGSDAANSELRRRLSALLEPLIETSSDPPAAQAVYIRDFEIHKRAINFDEGSDSQLETTLGGREGTQTIPLTLSGQQVKDIMHAGYESTLNLISTTNRRLYEFKVDLAVLYCGGTLANPGARSILDRDLNALNAQGHRVRSAFLIEKDANWSTAVSAGAALCIMNMPLPGRLLTKSAIGIQVVYEESNEYWVGEDEADTMFCGGGGPIRSSKQNACEPSNKVEFSLVIDPDYNWNRSRTTRDFVPIRISAPDDVFTGPYATHDLGLYIYGDELPKGDIRFDIYGELLEKFAKGVISAGEANHEEIPFVLTCVGLNAQGTESRGALDTQWQGIIRTDPGSKRLIVEGVQKLAVWCMRCLRELEGVAHACDSCSHYFLCSYCIMQVKFKKNIHQPDHSFSAIRLRETRKKGSVEVRSLVSKMPKTAAARRARAAYREDFPAGATPISTSGHGRQCAWRALVASWNAQHGCRYRGITLEELTKNFEGLREQNPLLGEFMENTHTYRVDQMAFNIADFASKTFGVTVQMGYIYPEAGDQKEVLVPIADGLEAAFRVWVFNNNIRDGDWSNAHFEGLKHSRADEVCGVGCSDENGAGPVRSRGVFTSRKDFEAADKKAEEIQDADGHALDDQGEESATFTTAVTTARPSRARTPSICDSCRRHKFQCYRRPGDPCRQCTKRMLPCRFTDFQETDWGSRSSSATIFDDHATRMHGGDVKVDRGSQPNYKTHPKQAAHGTANATRALFRAEKAWSVANVEAILPGDIVPSAWTQRTVSSLNHLARLTGVQHRSWAIAELKRQVDAQPIPRFDNRRTLREAAVRATIEEAKRRGKVSKPTGLGLR